MVSAEYNDTRRPVCSRRFIASSGLKAIKDFGSFQINPFVVGDLSPHKLWPSIKEKSDFFKK